MTAKQMTMTGRLAVLPDDHRDRLMALAQDIGAAGTAHRLAVPRPGSGDAGRRGPDRVAGGRGRGWPAER